MKSKTPSQHSIDTFRETATNLHTAFHAKMAKYGPNLFRVGHVKHLSSGYLETFDTPELRKEHDCTACREFMRQWGNLVFITPGGDLVPAFWDADEATDDYQDAIHHLETRLRGAQVTGVAYSEYATLGHTETNGFPHFGIILDGGNVQMPKGSLTSAMAMEASKGEDFKTLKRALSEYDMVYLEQVEHLLKTEKLNRHQELLPTIQFLIDTKNKIAAASKVKTHRTNVLWRIVASANSALCSPRSTVLGKLLDDLISGVSVEDAIADFNERTAPDKYMRPTAAPTAGNVSRAEVLISQLNLELALERRWAGMSEIQTLWTPKAVAQGKPKDGVFGHLVTKDEKRIQAKELPTIKGGEITWAKFARTVLPDALKMEVYIGSSRHALGAMVTAVNKDAPPLVRWDREDARNPVSFYVHTKGQFGRHFGLLESDFNEVVGIVKMPWEWNDPQGFPKNGVLFVLDGAQDTSDAGLAIFAEDLRHELHEIRSTIEAYSNDGQLTHVDEQEVAGLHFIGHTNQQVRVRVSTKTGKTVYILDRME